MSTHFSFVWRAFAVATILLTSWVPSAQAQPAAKTLRIVVPYPPGGISDILARQLASRLTARSGQPVVVENRSGAGAMIGADLVAKSPTDGSVVLIGGQQLLVGPLLYKRLSVDPLRDLKPIVQVGWTPNVLVVANDHPAGTVQELVAMARRTPGALNYASVGNGSILHLTAELFKIQSATSIVGVTYRGAPETIPAVMSRQVDFMFDSMAASGAQVQGGKLRALAVTGPQRDPLLPQVPTMMESGFPNFQFTTWNAIWIPSGTPTDVAQRLEKDFMAVLDAPETVEAIRKLGVTVTNLPARAIAKIVDDEARQWADVLKTAGIKPE